MFLKVVVLALLGTVGAVVEDHGELRGVGVDELDEQGHRELVSSKDYYDVCVCAEITFPSSATSFFIFGPSVSCVRS